MKIRAIRLLSLLPYIHNFLFLNLYALFVATNAPGRSSYNRVERKMAPLSRDLSGLILPHDHFGTQLNSAGSTVDLDLKNIYFGLLVKFSLISGRD